MRLTINNDRAMQSCACTNVCLSMLVSLKFNDQLVYTNHSYLTCLGISISLVWSALIVYSHEI